MISTSAQLVATPAAGARPCSSGHGYQWRARVELGMDLGFMNDITTNKRPARRLGKRPT
jgi:hypothetical protein